MSVIDTADTIKKLSDFLCIPLDEIWESHVGKDIKAEYTLEQIKEALKEKEE